MEILILLWIALAALIGSIGMKRGLGYYGPAVISLIFSPLVGFIYLALASKNVNQTNAKDDIASKLKVLNDLRRDGAISEMDFERAKSKLLTQ